MNFRHMDKSLNLCELSLDLFVAVFMKQNVSKQLCTVPLSEEITHPIFCC